MGEIRLEEPAELNCKHCTKAFGDDELVWLCLFCGDDVHEQCGGGCTDDGSDDTDAGEAGAVDPKVGAVIGVLLAAALALAAIFGIEIPNLGLTP